MWLPEDCNVADVNSETVFLEDEIPAEWIWFNEKQNVVMAKFARSELEEILEPGEVELTVSGHLTDGSYFVGTDTVKVVGKGRKL
jgi:nicotinate-nucleotide pyrophosphorylase